jgi:hypothetical protein
MSIHSDGAITRKRPYSVDDPPISFTDAEIAAESREIMVELAHQYTDSKVTLDQQIGDMLYEAANIHNTPISLLQLVAICHKLKSFNAYPGEFADSKGYDVRIFRWLLATFDIRELTYIIENVREQTVHGKLMTNLFGWSTVGDIHPDIGTACINTIIFVNLASKCNGIMTQWLFSLSTPQKILGIFNDAVVDVVGNETHLYVDYERMDNFEFENSNSLNITSIIVFVDILTTMIAFREVP